MYTEGNQSQNAEVEHGRNWPEQAPPPRCANCDIEILWTPVGVGEKTYCCRGCAAGGPCNCDYSQYRSITIAGVIHYGTN
jgi:hypothetical protein